jgi:hypothetical protein
MVTRPPVERSRTQLFSGVNAGGAVTGGAIWAATGAASSPTNRATRAFKRMIYNSWI